MDYDAFLEKYNRLPPEYKLVVDTYIDFLIYSLQQKKSTDYNDKKSGKEKNNDLKE